MENEGGENPIQQQQLSPAPRQHAHDADDVSISRVDDDGNNNDNCVNDEDSSNIISAAVATTDKNESNKNVPSSPPPPPKKRQKREEERPPTQLDPVRDIAEMKQCDECQISKPRSKYNKKQWNKVYGGWRCLDCAKEERSKQRHEANQLLKTLKQRQHDQKIREQSAKKQGIFMNERPCFQCGQNLSKTQYSGKQWKKLYRQCQPCVNVNGFQNTLLLEPTTNNDGKKKGSTTKNHHNDGSKYCSGCKETKLKDQFPPQQWTESIKNADRLCTICWEEEGQAKKEHLQLSANHHNKDIEKRCYGCHLFLNHSSYSSKQLSKKYGMCIDCVEVVQNDRKDDLIKGREYSTRPCSICLKQKPLDEFSKGQWKRSDPRCKLCAVVLVQKMDKHRQLEKDFNNNNHNNANADHQGGDDNITTTTEVESPPKKRRCFQCEKFQGQDKYSIRQWTKTYPICVDHVDDGKRKATEV